jgi:predicted DNA repair protein MutK
MAGASLLTLFDDIATVLDDVAAMTKIAAKKTSGVLGDDLALNAEQVSGVRAARELPVVWAVAVGSIRNKLILLPLALLFNALAPWAVMPLLMIGGAYLCYEGFEKIAHSFLHTDAEEQQEQDELLAAVAREDLDILALEKEKIKGAIRTDFVLSAEIMIITLGTVATAPFMSQLTVLSLIAVVMTVGVYGLVAAIVKLDDMGLYLQRHAAPGGLGSLQKLIGGGLLAFAPLLMKSLTVIGTVAMFMVGGGILTHGLPFAHHWSEDLTHIAQGLPGGQLLVAITPMSFDTVLGVVAGALVLAGVSIVSKIRSRRA